MNTGIEYMKIDLTPVRDILRHTGGHLSDILRNILAWIGRGRKILLTLLILMFVLFWITAAVPWISSHSLHSAKLREIAPDKDQQILLEKELKRSNRASQTMQYTLKRYTPGTAYVVINTNENSFALNRGDRTLLEGVCSTGSYTLLKGGENQQWVFKTPKGMFRIQGKKEAPVWKKPDWAFVEEGLPVPSVNDPSRFEYGVLGDYALALGDGYLIHGTLYKRFLGLPVTHGCIRLNDDDLYAVYRTLEPGSKVFIF